PPSSTLFPYTTLFRSESLAEVNDPSRGVSVLKAWTDRGFADGKAEWARLNRERRWRGEPARPFEMNVAALGSGSDYTAFEDHLRSEEHTSELQSLAYL